MLKYFYENDLVRLPETMPNNWEESIRLSGENLMEKGIITEQYLDEIVDGVHNYGPYIVIVPGVAMPHSSDKSEGVKGTAISFTKLKEPVYFEEGNEEKQARLFFTLAAKNPDEHMDNIMNLSEMLMTDGLIEDLENIDTMADYEEVMKKYA
jgi:PTS system ascorbate-specific IIA component